MVIGKTWNMGRTGLTDAYLWVQWKLRHGHQVDGTAGTRVSQRAILILVRVPVNRLESGIFRW